jgi:hypothetical protein
MLSANRKSVRTPSKSSPSSHKSSSTPPSGAPVFGQADHPTLAEIDHLAEQMMMPRSWVVTQILREWAEGRAAELRALEQSWNGSYREQMARAGATV